RMTETPDPTLLRMTAVVDGEVVGYVDLHGDSDDESELGFAIGDSKRWGKGLGMAAAAAGSRMDSKSSGSHPSGQRRSRRTLRPYEYFNGSEWWISAGARRNRSRACHPSTTSTG